MRTISTCLCLALAILTGKMLRAAEGFDLPPVSYSSAAAENPVTALQTRIDSGQAAMNHDDRLGYLQSVLDELKIPVDSQVLVFSQTSLQRHLITPETPRAIYFNDDVYLGYCNNGEVLEISTADSRLGTVFYTLNQQRAGKPQMIRQTDQCLQCHHSSRTESVPGHLVRSLFVGKSGVPIYSGGSYTVDHTTPLENRWGGWYVTGTHGDQKHLGNLVVPTSDVPATVDNSTGHNQAEVPASVLKSAYLSPHSDLVAHLVLDHQVLVHNRITRASFTTRQALAADAEMRKILGETEDKLLDSTVRRIENAGEDLVEAILFVDEARLTSPVTGTSGFRESFSRRGPCDSKGRSLRDFDLTTRMFKHPCSYLIGSESFRKLPAEMLRFVWSRLHGVLVNGDDAKKYAHLSANDRKAIVEILVETEPESTADWRGVSTE
ncbi:hypothetical protein Pan44_09130 [Caulifigura coniformis]|uniref:Cytochrome c domain-containing protein n=1 Tax=Caulifigura coniformis TaxID=2527983 RepID=A0A517S9U1_9PLAN|nr:hypothetical protein [Caulifigura coniformis]QDT52900.1 hypothetical protein Pan44_09130 [Caulifigura coniformis]